MNEQRVEDAVEQGVAYNAAVTSIDGRVAHLSEDIQSLVKDFERYCEWVTEQDEAVTHGVLSRNDEVRDALDGGHIAVLYVHSLFEAMSGPITMLARSHMEFCLSVDRLVASHVAHTSEPAISTEGVDESIVAALESLDLAESVLDVAVGYVTALRDVLVTHGASWSDEE